MPKVVVIGSANVDLTVMVDRLPRAGETVSGGEFFASFGGKGANQAVAAHRAGAEVIFVGKIGSDPNGQAIVDHLSSIGLRTDAVLRDPSSPSGVALIMVDSKGGNAIAVAPGSNRHLTREDVQRAERLVASGEVLLTQLEIPMPAVQEALSLAKADGLMTILDPAPARPLPREVLPLVDILTPNEVEVGTLSGITVKNQDQAAAAARKLLDSGAKQVIVTQGKEGACLVGPVDTRHYLSYAVDAVDSTAAGDAFNGALACALAEGRSMAKAIRFANAAGALAVTKRGAQDSLPTRDEIEDFMTRSP